MRGRADRVRFVVGGVQKGGTTALFDYLREVPALQLPDVKEVHFFDDESIDWSAPDYGRYHRRFVADGRIWGEATPIYLYWPNAPERIHAYAPDMRIVLLFRDPVERAFSQWKMEWAKRKETLPFAEAIRSGRARLHPGDPAAPGHHRVFSYVERGFYGHQLERVLQFFPREQLLLLRSEELDDSPDVTIARVCAFLQVPGPTAPLRPRRVYEAARIDYPSRLTDADRSLLAGLYSADQHLFSRLTGWDTSSSTNV